MSENEKIAQKLLPDRVLKGEVAPNPTGNKHRPFFFSKALFKETLKSNWVSWLIVSIGNILIVGVVILILSTLSINTTKDALSGLFDNADTETEIKQSAVGYYLDYQGAIQLYEGDGQTLSADVPQVYVLFEQALRQSTDSDNYQQVERLISSFDALYSATGDYGISKTTVVGIASAVIDADGNYNDQEKAVAKRLVGELIEVHHSRPGLSTPKELLQAAFPPTVYDHLLNDEHLDESYAAAVEAELVVAFADYDSGHTSVEAATDHTIALIESLAPEDGRRAAGSMAASLVDSYRAHPDEYADNDRLSATAEIGYRDLSLAVAVRTAMGESVQNIAYYQNLPSFIVAYVTNDKGEPVYYTAGTDAVGNPIKIEHVLEDYEPERMVPLEENMGTNSNMLQKQHKQELTGIAYTQAEKTQALAIARESAVAMGADLDDFMTEYISSKDEAGTNAYYNADTGTFDDVALLNRIVALMGDKAEQTLLDKYQVSSIALITADEYGIDGAAAISQVENYAISGVAAFGRQYQEDLGKGYDRDTAVLTAFVKATQGVMSQMPAKVMGDLGQLGEMNTYGIIVGIVFFGMSGLLLPMVYTITTANSLVAEKTETGSLAFTLATPIRRSTVVLTEANYLIAAETVMSIVLFLGALAARSIGIAVGSVDLIDSLPIGDIALYTVGNYMTMLAISGLCFMASCLFNKTKYAMGVGGGLTVFFLVCTILGLFGSQAMPANIRIEAMNSFNYLTIISLYDAQAVMNGDYLVYWLKLLGLLGISFIAYLTGVLRFDRKDLPL